MEIAELLIHRKFSEGMQTIVDTKCLIEIVTYSNYTMTSTDPDFTIYHFSNNTVSKDFEAVLHHNGLYHYLPYGIRISSTQLKPSSWSDAFRFCQLKGFDLFTTPSLEDLKAVSNALMKTILVNLPRIIYSAFDLDLVVSIH